MFAMHRLILAVLTLVNLSPTTLASLLTKDSALFGHGVEFDPFKSPPHILDPETHKVADTIPHNGLFNRQGTGKTIIFLDNDGVLINNNEDFPRAEKLLTALAANKDNEVWVNTARGLSSLKGYKSIPGLNIAAEHGTILLISQPDGSKILKEFLHPLAQNVRLEMSNLAETHKDLGMKVFPAKNVSAYKYNSAYSQEFSPVIGEIEDMLKDKFSDFMLRLEGTKAYGEVKHKESNKGNLVAYLMNTGKYQEGMAIGDQLADEGMFKALNHANQHHGGFFHTVIVSENQEQPTSANYRLNNVEKVHQLLLNLA